MRRFLLLLTLVTFCAIVVAAQQPTESRAGLNEAATGFDAKGTPAIEGKLLTTLLNGSDDLVQNLLPVSLNRDTLLSHVLAGPFQKTIDLRH